MFYQCELEHVKFSIQNVKSIKSIAELKKTEISSLDGTFNGDGIDKLFAKSKINHLEISMDLTGREDLDVETILDGAKIGTLELNIKGTSQERIDDMLKRASSVEKVVYK